MPKRSSKRRSLRGGDFTDYLKERIKSGHPDWSQRQVDAAYEDYHNSQKQSIGERLSNLGRNIYTVGKDAVKDTAKIFKDPTNPSNYAEALKNSYENGTKISKGKGRVTKLRGGAKKKKMPAWLAKKIWGGKRR